MRPPGHSRNARLARYQKENITEATVEKMEAQLKLWSLQINKLAAKIQSPGAQTGFDSLMYIDELKGLHAIAQWKFDEFKAAGSTGRARLKAEMESAWNELDVAFKTGSHCRKRRKADS